MIIISIHNECFFETSIAFFLMGNHNEFPNDKMHLTLLARIHYVIIDNDVS